MSHIHIIIPDDIHSDINIKLVLITEQRTKLNTPKIWKNKSIIFLHFTRHEIEVAPKKLKKTEKPEKCVKKAKNRLKLKEMETILR